MLTREEQKWVTNRAYIPEHLTHYLIPFSQMEPRLEGDFLVYAKDKTISLIGYPLQDSFSQEKLQQVADKLCQEYSPELINIMAPEEISIHGYELQRQEQDMVSRLTLTDADVEIGAKTRNMLVRAGRELNISVGKTYTMEHQRLLQGFIREKSFDKETSSFIHLLPDYVAFSPTATLIEARRKDDNQLVAYNVLEYSSGEYGFYLFNITYQKQNVPGSCDLLMEKMINMTKEAGKKYLNMGLDINMGIAWFKKKWGSEPFLQYRFMSFKRKTSFSTFFSFLHK